MTMYAQKYSNPTRIVSGTITVNNDDVVLGCNTSTGAVVLNLQAIAQNYWNTNWKLYIFDSANNASVNTITINAGAGQTINNSSYLVLNTNGAGAVIRILSNTKFIVELTNISTTGITLTTSGTSGAATLIGSVLNVPVYTSSGYTTVQNVGTPLTQRSTLNFKGGFLLAAADNPGTLATDVSVSNQSLYAILPLTNPATNYLPINGGLTSVPRSVLSGTVITNYTASTGYLGASFNTTTGVWTCPAFATYYVNANLVVRVNETDINSNVNAGGVAWVDPLPADQGSMSIGVIQLPNLSATNIVALSNRQHVTNDCSDINITTSGLITVNAGDQISVQVLNKTLIDVFGFAPSVSIEDMRIELGITRID